MKEKRNQGLFAYWFTLMVGIVFIAYGLVLLTRILTRDPQPVYILSVLIELLVSFGLTGMIALLNYYWVLKRLPIGCLIYVPVLIILLQIHHETIDYIKETLIPVMGAQVPSYLEPIAHLSLGVVFFVSFVLVNKKYNKGKKKFYLPLDEVSEQDKAD